MRFNSPFGILFVRTYLTDLCQCHKMSMFQFPIRNSVRSDATIYYMRRAYCAVSIPHSEFCSFGRIEDCRVSRRAFNVSIPHSEFCSFGPDIEQSAYEEFFAFQFPIRNSVRSDSRHLKQRYTPE